MTPRRFGVACVVVSLGLMAAALVTRSRGDAGLPFYADADFTPRWGVWSAAGSHRVGPFSLLDQTGSTLTHRDLAGRVVIVSFLYTRCSDLCPTLVRSLKVVERGLAGTDAGLVSFSVTPELDSPAVLMEFGRANAIDAGRWKLVTGDRDVIYSLARDSFFATDERLRGTLADDRAVLHTEKLVLVDRRGRLRGVYNGTLPREVELLVEDARRLASS